MHEISVTVSLAGLTGQSEARSYSLLRRLSLAAPRKDSAASAHSFNVRDVAQVHLPSSSGFRVSRNTFSDIRFYKPTCIQVGTASHLIVSIPGLLGL